MIIKTFSLKKGVNIMQFLFTLMKVCLISCLRQTKVLNWIVKQCLRFNLFDNLKGETFSFSIKNPKWSHLPLQPPKSTMIQIMVQFLSLKIGICNHFPHKEACKSFLGMIKTWMVKQLQAFGISLNRINVGLMV
jgi:hypothetical protein